VSADDGVWKRFSDGSIRLFDVLLQAQGTGTILDSLARIAGETLGVDRSMIFDISYTEDQAYALSEWLNPAHPEVTSTKATFPLAGFRASTRFVHETHEIIVTQATAPHPTLVEDCSVELVHGDMAIKSALWYPFSFRRDGFYLLVFNHVVAAHEWTAPEIEFMRTATRHVSMALVKTELEEGLRARTGELLQANDLLRQSLREKEVLLHEIHHRVRNNLQMIISLLHLQLANSADARARDALIESENRVHAIALAHELLYESDDLASVDVGEYLRVLVRQLRYSVTEPLAAELIVTAKEVHLDVEQVVSCGLIVTELVMNSLTHAFPDERSGHVWVAVTRRGPQIVLEVRDDGAGFAPDATEGVGLHVTRALGHRLGGMMELDRRSGTTVRVVFPAHTSVEAPPEAAGPAR